MSQLFTGLFSTTETTISIIHFALYMGTSIVLGVFMAMMYRVHSKCTQSFFATLSLLPLSVCMIIMMVNGNIGAGVAVAGAFGLVRFRSMPGTGKEISAIFTAMCTGLTIGMGYIGFGVLFAVIACLFALILNMAQLGNHDEVVHTLQITIPENINYVDTFDEVFANYTKHIEQISVKTTNMGSMFKLTYEIELINTQDEKELIDAIRCRNGNLEVVLHKVHKEDNGL